MSETSHILTPRASNVGGILILLAAIPPLGLALYAVAGPVVAAAACIVYAMALGLTVRAERHRENPSRDPATGLPDRAAAIARLERIFEQRTAGSSQAAVFVIAMAVPQDDEIPESEGHPLAFIAIARLAQGLRSGDQIIRIGEHSLAAILGPSRGLTERAAEGILDRMHEMFREPFRVGTTMVNVRVSLGACLQHDAPRADALSWLEAAELAAQIAAEDGDPRLFPAGATRVDRSAWDEQQPDPAVPEGEPEAEWRAAREHCPDSPADLRNHGRRRSA